MNRYAQFPHSWQFVPIAVLTFAAALAVAWYGMPQLKAYGKAQGRAFAQIAHNDNDTLVKVAAYRLAHAADPSNPAYREQLATLYIQQGDIIKASGVLGTTDQERVRKAELLMRLGRYDDGLRAVQPLGTTEAAVVRSKIYLEAGRVEDAINAVASPASPQERLQHDLSLKVAANTTQTANASQRASAEPTGPTQTAETNGLALAQQLYGLHLYKTTQAVLTNAPDSVSKYLLLSSALEAAQPSNKEQLNQAAEAAQKGIRIDPSNNGLHQRLLEVYQRLHNRQGIEEQQHILDQLQSGQV